MHSGFKKAFLAPAMGLVIMATGTLAQDINIPRSAYDGLIGEEAGQSHQQALLLNNMEWQKIVDDMERFSDLPVLDYHYYSLVNYTGNERRLQMENLFKQLEPIRDEANDFRFSGHVLLTFYADAIADYAGNQVLNSLKQYEQNLRSLNDSVNNQRMQEANEHKQAAIRTLTQAQNWVDFCLTLAGGSDEILLRMSANFQSARAGLNTAINALNYNQDPHSSLRGAHEHATDLRERLDFLLPRLNMLKAHWQSLDADISNLLNIMGVVNSDTALRNFSQATAPLVNALSANLDSTWLGIAAETRAFADTIR